MKERKGIVVYSFEKLKEIKPNWFFKVIDNDCASFNIMKVVGNIFEHSELLN